MPEATPAENILGLPEDSLADWTEDAEIRFHLWGKNPDVCDWKREKTLAGIQTDARTEALVSGDVLVFLHNSRRTGMPSVQLIRGESVRTPYPTPKIAKGNVIKHGVELNSLGRKVAYHILQENGGYKRLPATGEKSGRKLAWMVYGTDKRLDQVRGQPLLAIVLQSLKEIDRYRDSTQRKAVVNSMIAMAIKKTKSVPTLSPLSGGAVKKNEAIVQSGDGTERKFNFTTLVPGTAIEELQEGEEPVFYGGQGTDAEFASFESSVLGAIAWACQMPPEIMTLAFSSNYSASQAAINEFKIYLEKFWADFGEEFCAPIWVEWLLSSVLAGKIVAESLLAAWRDPLKHDVFAAWVSAEWYGSVKPSTDMFKATKGSKMAVEEGWSNNAREARGLTGTKYSRNIRRLKRENEQKAEAMEPLLKLYEKLAAARSTSSEDGTSGANEANANAVAEMVLDAIEEQLTGAVA